LKEHIQQAVALMLSHSRELQDRDMEAIGMPDDDSVSAGQSVPVLALVVQNCNRSRLLTVLLNRLSCRPSLRSAVGVPNIDCSRVVPIIVFY
jgi:hypothetical protein